MNSFFRVDRRLIAPKTGLIVFVLLSSIGVVSFSAAAELDRVGEDTVGSESAPLIAESVDISEPAQKLVSSFLTEVVALGDLNLNEARHKGNEILAKYFGNVFGSDYLMFSILQLIEPNLEFKLDHQAILSPVEESQKLEKAMAEVVLQENARRLFLGFTQSVREIERQRLSEGSVFLSEELQTQLLKHPLSFSVASTGKMVFNPKNKNTTYYVGVKLIPELEVYGEAVEVIYLVDKDTRGRYSLSDFIFSKSISARLMHIETIKELLINSVNSKNIYSDIIHSTFTQDAMKRWNIDEPMWKMLALELAQ